MQSSPEHATTDLGADKDQPAGAGSGRRSAALLALRGLLAVVVGVMVLAWPEITLLVLAFLFAAWVFVDGIGFIASAVDARGSRRWWYLLAGVVGIIAGVAAAVWPGVTVLVLVMWAGAWALVTGVLEMAAATREEGSARWLSVLAGGLSVVAGLVLLLLPGVGALTLATVLGVYALAAGVCLLWAAWQARRASVASTPA